MKRTTLLLISGCFFSAVMIVVSLYLFSNRINQKKNGFLRLFPPHLIEYRKSLDIKYNSYYIAGISSGNVYLGNVTYPMQLLRINYATMDSAYLNLDIHDGTRIAWKALTVKIDSPAIFIYDYITPVLLKGDLISLQLYPIKITNSTLNRFLPISFVTYVNTVYDKNIQQDVLEKGSIGSQTGHFVPSIYVLNKQIDGTFSPDGILNYFGNKNLLVYVYYYHNRFDCLDTNLSLLYTSKTIDTISEAKIKLASVKSEGIITQAAPPLIVNKLSCMDRNMLYVNSSLLADNEDRKLFDKASVIDIYDLRDGSYKYSFYLPDFAGHKISGFQVVDSVLIAMYGQYILTYRLRI